MDKSLQELLVFFKVEITSPYYISSGKPILKYPENPFRIDFYVFCICVTGSVIIEVNTEKHLLGENSFLILSPSSYVRFKKIESNTNVKLLMFEKKFLLKNVSNRFIIDKMNLFRNKYYSLVKCCEETERLLNLLNYLDERSTKDSYYKEEIIRTIIFNILLEVADIVNELPPVQLKKPQKKLFLQFEKLVDSNILESHCVDFYADKLCISSKYLVEIVKDACGQTPHKYINGVLLNEAYILLNDNSLSIKQISDILKFNSSSAFGRFFRKHTSCSPSQYRIKESLI